MAAIEIDGFTDLELIGRGGFATVYAATQTRFGRRVALKILDLSLDDSGRARFERECLATGMLSDHPNVVTVYDAGQTPDGRPYLALQYLPGGTLKDLLATTGPLDPTTVTDIGTALAAALAEAHEQGILHRDIKPSNILLTADHSPKLADFGISRLTTDPRYAHASTASYSPEHVSPEQLVDQEITPATDVYSLASTLYALVEGHAPHATGPADTIHQILTRKIQGTPPTWTDRTPEPLRAVLTEALDHGPTRRPTATQFAHQLSGSVLAPNPTPPPEPAIDEPDPPDDRTIPRTQEPSPRTDGTQHPVLPDTTTQPDQPHIPTHATRRRGPATPTPPDPTPDDDRTGRRAPASPPQSPSATEANHEGFSPVHDDTASSSGTLLDRPTARRETNPNHTMPTGTPSPTERPHARIAALALAAIIAAGLAVLASAALTSGDGINLSRSSSTTAAPDTKPAPTITDEQIEQVYEERRQDQFERRCLEGVIFEASPLDAMGRASDVRDALDDGAELEDAVDADPDDPTAPQATDFGCVTRTDLGDPALVDVVFDAEVGSTVGPVDSGGVLIVAVIYDEQIDELDDVADVIRGELEAAASGDGMVGNDVESVSEDSSHDPPMAGPDN